MNFEIAELPDATVYTFESEALREKQAIAETRAQLAEAMLKLPFKENVIFDVSQILPFGFDAIEALRVARENVVASEKKGGRGGRFAVVGVNPDLQVLFTEAAPFTFKDSVADAIEHFSKPEPFFTVSEAESTPEISVLRIADVRLGMPVSSNAEYTRFSDELNAYMAAHPGVAVVLDFKDTHGDEEASLWLTNQAIYRVKGTFAVANLSEAAREAFEVSAKGEIKHPFSEPLIAGQDVEAAKAALAAHAQKEAQRPDSTGDFDWKNIKHATHQL